MAVREKHHQEEQQIWQLWRALSLQDDTLHIYPSPCDKLCTVLTAHLKTFTIILLYVPHELQLNEKESTWVMTHFADKKLEIRKTIGNLSWESKPLLSTGHGSPALCHKGGSMSSLAASVCLCGICSS